MGFNARVEAEQIQPEFLTIKIESDEAGLLIGQKGGSLDALQHVIRIIASKKLGQELPNFTIDINNYRTNRDELLKRTALTMAKEAIDFKTTRAFEPMSSYERRIIHLALVDFPGIKTESEGEGRERKVVIRPV